MPPQRVRSISIGMPTPTGTQEEESNDGDTTKKLLEILQQQKLNRKKLLEKQQKTILKQATEASNKYKEAVEKVLKEGEVKIGERIRKHQEDEKKLKEELAQTEREIVKLMQVECSDTKLATASVTATIEENEQARASLITNLDKLLDGQNTTGQAVLDEMWEPVEGFEQGEEDDEEEEEYGEYQRGSVSA